MAEVNPPYVLQDVNSDHDAILFRRAWQTIIDEGVSRHNGKNDLLVKQDAPVGMTVIVELGGAFVRGDDVNSQGVYYVHNDADVTLVVPASDPTNPRKDIVVARVKDDFHGQPGNLWSLEYIAGVPAGSPDEPALPATALKLATVDVAAEAASVSDANITDHRTRAVAAGALGARVIYEADGTFDKADFPWARQVQVMVQAGGGGGGGVDSGVSGQAGAASGGAGGTYAESLLDIEDLAASEVVTVGAGGAGGVAGTNGAAGGASSFGSHVSANGGGGGQGTGVAGNHFIAAGGGADATAIGDLVVIGDDGGNSVRNGGVQVMLGAGGASHLGGAQQPHGATGGGGTQAGALYGGGGAGAHIKNTGGPFDGGDGADGIVIVEVYA